MIGVTNLDREIKVDKCYLNPSTMKFVRSAYQFVVSMIINKLRSEEIKMHRC